MRLPSFALFGALLGFPVSLIPAAPKPPPNIVILLVDDMGWADFSCFGDKVSSTPGIDRLAAEGRRFEQFYVNAPICSPSRAAILTGQYPQRWRINSYLDNRATNARRGMADWLDPKAPSLARILREAGYVTGHFGKWHLGGQRDVGDAPLITEYGFDASLTSFEGLGPRVLARNDAYDGKPPVPWAMGSDKLGRGPIYWEDRSKVTSRYADAALAFIKKAEAEGKPFFLNLWPDDVHSPWFPPKDKRGDGSNGARYHGVLEAMDAQLAPVLDFIEKNPRLRENTIVLVFSDNGPERGGGSAGPFRGFKGQLYEGGIRSPLIVWAPGRIPPGAVGTADKSSFLAAIDLLPSLVKLAGASLPPSVRPDGLDMSDVLLGGSARSRRQPLFFRRPPDRKEAFGTANLPDLSVRDGKWKLLCDYDGRRPELYDLDADPGETRNLAATHPDDVRRLKDAVLAWNRALPPAVDDPTSGGKNSGAAPAGGPGKRSPLND